MVEDPKSNDVLDVGTKFPKIPAVLRISRFPAKTVFALNVTALVKLDSELTAIFPSESDNITDPTYMDPGPTNKSLNLFCGVPRE